MKAVFCGSFDPVTLGHMDLIERSAKIFESVGVVVSPNSLKNNFCTDEQKLKWLQEACRHLPNVDVFVYSGLAAEACRSYGASVLIRGVRNETDFAYEANMAFMNRQVDGNIETLSLFCDPAYAYVSSSNVRELLKYGLSTEKFVPACVFRDLQPELYRASRQK